MYALGASAFVAERKSSRLTPDRRGNQEPRADRMDKMDSPFLTTENAPPNEVGKSKLMGKRCPKRPDRPVVGRRGAGQYNWDAKQKSCYQ